jgi:hypothetical protein
MNCAYIYIKRVIGLFVLYVDVDVTQVCIKGKCKAIPVRERGGP